jgi:hypothetical protein
MAALSDVMEARVLNYFRGTAMPAAPSAVYVGLFSSDPTDAGAGTEVTTTIRPAGRVVAAFGAPTVSGTAQQIANSATVDFGVAAGGATVTHFGVFDAASAGNLLWHAPLTGGAQLVATNNEVAFAAGTLTFSLA